jgi:processing peptidase subunit alpha
VQVADPLLAGAAAGAAPAAPKSTYTGGFLACLSPGAEPTVAVAFEAKGGLGDLKSTATAAVVKALLGSSSREVLPYTRKTLDGPLTSVTPLVQVRLLSISCASSMCQKHTKHTNQCMLHLILGASAPAHM